MSKKRVRYNPEEPETRTWIDAEKNETVSRRFSDEELVGWLKEKLSIPGSELIVGTDSHRNGRWFRFISVVCIYTQGIGGFYFYTTFYKPRQEYKGRQQVRMFKEAETSIEVANWLFEKTERIPVVHIDASPSDAGQFTSSFSDSLKGYVTSSGFQCVLKPEAIVASCVADRHTKV